MNRSAKATIFLLLICVGVLVFLLVYENHEHRNQMHTLQVNSQYGIVSSNEIDMWIDGIEQARSDTSRQNLFLQYKGMREHMEFWNNERLFSLAYVTTENEENHDSLLSIYKSYCLASSDIRTFMILHEDGNDLKSGDIEQLIGDMHGLSDATARFENFDFNE